MSSLKAALILKVQKYAAERFLLMYREHLEMLTNPSHNTVKPKCKAVLAAATRRATIE